MLFLQNKNREDEENKQKENELEAPDLLENLGTEKLTDLHDENAKKRNVVTDLRLNLGNYFKFIFFAQTSFF